MRVAALIVGLALAGCSSMKLAPDAEPPANYRELVLQRAQTYFPNPDSIRDAQIAPPARSGGPVLISTGAPTEVWVVCVRANRQNFLGYDKLSETAFLIHNGQVVDVYENAVWTPTCKNEKFEPFPELVHPA
jgi:hypothetical protein